MKHTIEVDDRSSAGKGLLNIAKELEGKNKGVRIIDHRKEDKALLQRMIKARQRGLLNKEEKEEFIQYLKKSSSL